jgi:hypothetical protein
VSHRDTRAHTDLPTDTHPHADATVADLPTVSHQYAKAHTDLPADTHPDADLPPNSYRIPGGGYTDCNTNSDIRADGGALAYPDGAGGRAP